MKEGTLRALLSEGGTVTQRLETGFARRQLRAFFSSCTAREQSISLQQLHSKETINITAAAAQQGNSQYHCSSSTARKQSISHSKETINITAAAAQQGNSQYHCSSCTAREQSISLQQLHSKGTVNITGTAAPQQGNSQYYSTVNITAAAAQRKETQAMNTTAATAGHANSQYIN